MTIHVTPMTSPSAAPARFGSKFARPLLDLITKVITRRTATPPQYARPVQPPHARPPGTVDGIDQYGPGTRVWAYIASAWLPASVADITGSSVLITYTAPGSADTMVETLHATHVQLRDRPVRTSPAHRTDGSEVLPTAGGARVTLRLHYPDELGLCTACADLAHFRLAPCPAAQQAMTVLGINPATAVGAP